MMARTRRASSLTRRMTNYASQQYHLENFSFVPMDVNLTRYELWIELAVGGQSSSSTGFYKPYNTATAGYETRWKPYGQLMSSGHNGSICMPRSAMVNNLYKPRSAMVNNLYKQITDSTHSMQNLLTKHSEKSHKSLSQFLHCWGSTIERLHL